MTNFTLRPMTVSERKYSYVQSPQIQGQTGNIGYLRGDFGSNGNWFYTTCNQRLAFTELRIAPRPCHYVLGLSGK